MPHHKQHSAARDMGSRATITGPRTPLRAMKGAPGPNTTKRSIPMKSSRLARLARMIVALLAVFAFGAIVAGAAQAASAPFWTVGGNRLETNETKEIVVKSFEGTKSPIVLEAELLGIKAKVECHLANVAKGSVIVGSAGNVPGFSEEVAEFTDCTTVNTGAGCKVNEPIKTEKIRNELVESTTEPRTILIEFDPATGTTGTFVVLHFTGAGCAVKETTVGNGLVVGSSFTDPTITGKEAEAIKTSSGRSEASYLIKFPDEATEVILWKGGAEEKLKIKPFEAFGHTAKLTGTVLVSLASGQKYGTE